MTRRRKQRQCYSYWSASSRRAKRRRDFAWLRGSSSFGSGRDIDTETRRLSRQTASAINNEPLSVGALKCHVAGRYTPTHVQWAVTDRASLSWTGINHGRARRAWLACWNDIRQLCVRPLFHLTETGGSAKLRVQMSVTTEAHEVLLFNLRLRKHEAQLSQRDRATRYVSISSCYLSRGMAVRRVSVSKVTFKIIQVHWHWRHSIGHIRFPISLSLQLSILHR